MEITNRASPLVVPRKHVASLFELEPTALTAIWEMVREVRAMLIQRYRPDGFNIGLNDGPAAGQTVMHAHIHLIPRGVGDVPDPRGGCPMDNTRKSSLLDRTMTGVVVERLPPR